MQIFRYYNGINSPRIFFSCFPLCVRILSAKFSSCRTIYATLSHVGHHLTARESYGVLKLCSLIKRSSNPHLKSCYTDYFPSFLGLPSFCCIVTLKGSRQRPIEQIPFNFNGFLIYRTSYEKPIALKKIWNPMLDKVAGYCILF